MIDLGLLPRGTDYTIRQITKAATLTSPQGGADIRVNRTGDRWGIEIDVQSLRYSACGAAMIADLARGHAEGVSVIIPQPKLTLTNPGALTVDGASQTGTTLNVKTGTPGVVLKKGRFIHVAVTISGGVRRYAYQLTADATINGAGKAALAIWPMIRRSPANSDAVETMAPRFEGLLDGEGLEYSPRRIGGVGFKIKINERA